jgi:tRNA(Ile)-lysidine synthase
MDSSGADPVGRVLEASGLILERARLLGSRRPIVVAVSGGADSLCLLDVMVTLLKDAKRRIVVGHVDHQLRAESSSDADHVRTAAERYGVRCEVARVDVPALAAAERRGIEEAARVGRYRALRAIGASVGTNLVATGHTRDDSIETVLMHLVRGSGMRGLGGIAEDEWLDVGAEEQAARDRGHPGPVPRAARMAAVPGVRVIRPLLGVRRADTTAYCEARGATWLSDPTNTDPRMLRNRVRGHLLPVLRTYNPAVDEALSRLALVMRDEERVLQQVAEQQWRRLVREEDDSLVVDLVGWRKLVTALQRRLVRQIAASLGHDELGFEAVERALAVGRPDGPPRAQLGGGLVVERRPTQLVFHEQSEVTA